MKKTLLSIVLALCIGLAAGAALARRAAPEPELTVRLHRFRLKRDQLKTFDAWVAFERAHHAETVATLEREKMYGEAIFRDREKDPTTIYWLEIRGAKGASVDTSPLAIDKVYERYMKATLVPHSRRTMRPEYVLVPPFVMRGIAEHEGRRLKTP